MIECDIFSIDENLKLIVTTYSYDKVIDEDEYDQIFNYIESLKYSTPFDRIRKEPYDYSDWDDYAKKGIIAYDNFSDNASISFGHNRYTNRYFKNVRKILIEL